MSRRGRLWLAALALALGAAVRLGVATSARLWFDEATTGLMGLHVLRGRFPFFFYGQAYMGAAEAYLHAVALAVVRPPTDAVRLWPAGLSLVHALLAGLLAGRVFGEGRWAALLVLLPSPFLLKWSYDARLHYDLVLVLAPLLVLLTLRAVDLRASHAARTRAVLVFALVAGLAWWTNLVLGAPVVAGALVLALWRRRLPRGAWAAPLAFLLGGAPVWLFAWRYRHLAASGVPLAPAGAVARQIGQLGANALPIMLGVPSSVMGRASGETLGRGVVALFLLAAAVALTDRRADRPGRLALLALGLLVVGAAVLTVPGASLASEDPRYLLPLLTVAPVLVGGALSRLARRWPRVVPGVGLALVALSLYAVVVEYPALLPGPARQARWAFRASVDAEVRLLRSRGLRAVYTHDSDTQNLTFVSGERVTVSQFYEDPDPLIGQRVDAAAEVAYLGDPPPGFEPSLAAAGIHFAREPSPIGPLYTRFSLTGPALREVSPQGWVATASPHPELASQAVDRDGVTRWSTRSARAGGMWLQVDLGRPRDVAMVAWLPGAFEEVPSGFRLEASADARAWTTVRDVPRYYGPLYWSGGHPMGRVRWGRVEVRFPPVAARFLRITHLGQDRHLWTVRELFVYETAPDPAPGEPGASPGPVDGRLDAGGDARSVVWALRGAGVRRVFADHALAARLAEASAGDLAVPPDNVRIDPYGWAPGVNDLPALKGRPAEAVVLPTSAPETPGVLDLLRGAGWRDDLVGVPGLAIATVRIEPGRGRVGAWSGASPGSSSVLATSGGRSAASGELTVDLGQVVEVGGAVLIPGPGLPSPGEIAIEIRSDSGWVRVPSTMRVVGPLAWAGTHVLRSGVQRIEYRFGPVPVRAFRLVRAGDSTPLSGPGATLQAIGP